MEKIRYDDQYTYNNTSLGNSCIVINDNFYTAILYCYIYWLITHNNLSHRHANQNSIVYAGGLVTLNRVLEIWIRIYQLEEPYRVLIEFLTYTSNPLYLVIVLQDFKYDLKLTVNLTIYAISRLHSMSKKWSHGKQTLSILETCRGSVCQCDNKFSIL